MTNLEHVDVGHQPAVEQRRLDRRLGIAGEQHAEARVAQDRHDRAVVDVALGKWRGGIGSRRVDHLQARDAAEGEPIAGPGKTSGDPTRRCIRQELVVRGVLERDPGVEHELDSVSPQHVDQPGDMILVRMRQE